MGRGLGSGKTLAGYVLSKCRLKIKEQVIIGIYLTSPLFHVKKKPLLKEVLP